ncbi:MAG: hypothetical protein WAS73_10980, partial [Defluviicoccus sp.]
MIARLLLAAADVHHPRQQIRALSFEACRRLLSGPGLALQALDLGNGDLFASGCAGFDLVADILGCGGCGQQLKHPAIQKRRNVAFGPVPFGGV